MDGLNGIGPAAGSMGGYPRGSGLGMSNRVSYGAPPAALSSTVPANVAPPSQAMVPARPGAGQGESKTMTYLLYGGGALLAGYLVYTFFFKDKASAAPSKRVQYVSAAPMQHDGYAPQGYAQPGYSGGYAPQGYAPQGHPQQEEPQPAAPITMGGSNVAMPRMGGGRGGGFGTGIQGIPAVPEGTYQH